MTAKPVCSYLGESDILGVLSEALTADVQVVFADDTPLVATHSAARSNDSVKHGPEAMSRRTW